MNQHEIIYYAIIHDIKYSCSRRLLFDFFTSNITQENNNVNPQGVLWAKTMYLCKTSLQIRIYAFEIFWKLVFTFNCVHPLNIFKLPDSQAMNNLCLLPLRSQSHSRSRIINTRFLSLNPHSNTLNLNNG